MVAVLEGSPVPRSICLTSTSSGARMLGFLAGISRSSRLISAAIVAISFLPSVACAFAAIWIAYTSMHALNRSEEKEHR